MQFIRVRKVLLITILIFSFTNEIKSQAWQYFGNPFDTTLVFSSSKDSANNIIYFGGALPGFNGLQGNYIWKWSNTQLDPVGSSFRSNSSSNSGHGGTAKLSFFNDTLVSAGTFDSIGNHKFKMPIAKWDGNDWLPFDTTTLVTHPQGGNLKPHIDDIIAFNNKLFIIGSFRYDDPIFPFSNTFWEFAYYDSSGWQCAFNNQTLSLIPLQPNFNVYDNELYIGGCIFFDTCLTAPSSGIQSAKGLARYNSQCQSIEYVGSNWGNIPILDMVNHNGSMYIGFKGVHPIYGSNITRFDGVNFYPVGAGLNGEVQALGVYNGQLVAGGLFTSDAVNTQPLNSIAVWDGFQWNPFPSNCLLNHSVYYINILDSLIISSGNLDSCGIVQASKSVVFPNGLTTDYEAQSENITFTVFPNPSNRTFSIRVNGTNNSLINVTIHDMIGKIVHAQKLNPYTNQTEIKMEDSIKSGVYTIRLCSSTMSNQLKINILNQ